LAWAGLALSSGGARSHTQRSVPPRSAGAWTGFRRRLQLTASPHIRSGAKPVPTFRMLAARKPWGWDPSTNRLLFRPKGGTVTIHPALTAVALRRCRVDW